MPFSILKQEAKHYIIELVSVRPSNLTDLQKKRKMGANSDNILTEDNGGDLDPALLGELEWESEDL